MLKKSKDKAKRRRPREMILLFIGSHLIIFTNLFIPGNLKTVRLIGFLAGAFTLLIFLIIILKRIRKRRLDS